MTASVTQPAPTGERIQTGFSYLETGADDIDVDAIRDILLDGDHNGAVVYVIRNAFDHATAQAVSARFDSIIASTQGGSRPDDGYVKTQQIGSTQFAKTGREYVLDHAARADDLAVLLDDSPAEAIENIFRTTLVEDVLIESGVTFRPSRYKNLSGGFATFRRWLDNGEMALMPHEDSAQLKTAAQDGYEIAAADHVVSYNACIESGHSGGVLRVWNLKPDDDFRHELDLLDTGYPYPSEAIESIETFDLELNVGDVYFLNSSYIHGVTSVTSGQRMTAGRFIGRVADRTVVYWT